MRVFSGFFILLIFLLILLVKAYDINNHKLRDDVESGTFGNSTWEYNKKSL